MDQEAELRRLAEVTVAQKAEIDILNARIVAAEDVIRFVAEELSRFRSPQP